jgi:hypothetical protein
MHYVPVALRQALENPFEKFIEDPGVNACLQIVSSEIRKEVLRMGIRKELTILSGYEKERGDWATAYDNLIRFGEETIPVQGINKHMLLTPNFFYGRNSEGEEVEYRVGLVKEEEEVHIYPIVLGKTQDQKIQVKSLEPYVIHNGIDPQTPKQSSYQMFLGCFENIDIYLRKQSPEFHSDVDIEINESVGVFVSRIINDMLWKIVEVSKEDPNWMIPQSESKYIGKLISSVEESMDGSRRKIMAAVKSLCSYMHKFRNYQPLEELAKKDLNILPYVVENFGSLEFKVSSDATQTYDKAAELTPQFIPPTLPVILNMLSDPRESLQDYALGAYESVIEYAPQFITQAGADKLFTMLSDEDEEEVVPEVCGMLVKQRPDLTEPYKGKIKEFELDMWADMISE